MAIKKFEIIDLNEDNYKYKVLDEFGEIHDIILQFYNVDLLPQIGEYIYFSDKLFDVKLNEGIMHFNFGPLDQPYGKKITIDNLDDNIEEILKIEKEDKKIYLKRFYG